MYDVSVHLHVLFTVNFIRYVMLFACTLLVLWKNVNFVTLYISQLDSNGNKKNSVGSQLQGLYTRKESSLEDWCMRVF